MKLWKCILISFSIVTLSCAIKNYLIYFWHDSSFSGLICPSVFGKHSLYVTPIFLEKFYTFHTWIGTTAHSFILHFINDPLQVFLILVVAPVVEEILYRSPLFFLKNNLRNFIWWGLAVALSAIFAHSHSLYGLALLPLFVLGMCCSWLIKISGRFWPCIMLHFFFNFYTFSFSLYQGLFWGD